MFTSMVKGRKIRETPSTPPIRPQAQKNVLKIFRKNFQSRRITYRAVPSRGNAKYEPDYQSNGNGTPIWAFI